LSTDYLFNNCSISQLGTGLDFGLNYYGGTPYLISNSTTTNDNTFYNKLTTDSVKFPTGIKKLTFNNTSNSNYNNLILNSYNGYSTSNVYAAIGTKLNDSNSNSASFASNGYVATAYSSYLTKIDNSKSAIGIVFDSKNSNDTATASIVITDVDNSQSILLSIGEGSTNSGRDNVASLGAETLSSVYNTMMALKLSQ
jgi:hypothetical protein